MHLSAIVVYGLLRDKQGKQHTATPHPDTGYVAADVLLRDVYDDDHRKSAGGARRLKEKGLPTPKGVAAENIIPYTCSSCNLYTRSREPHSGCFVK